MSHSGVAEGGGEPAPPAVETGRLPELTDDENDGSVGVSGARRRSTGDLAVDEVLGRLDKVAAEPLDVQIEAGEQVHRVLQGRLADLAKE